MAHASLSRRQGGEQKWLLDRDSNLERGELDVAFLRTESKPDLEYKLVRKEPLVVILPSDHPLAANQAIDPHDLAGDTFIGISDVAPVLRASIKDYLKRSGVEIVPALEVDNFCNGDVSRYLQPRHGSAAGIHRGLFAMVDHQPSAGRRAADRRFGGRISQG
jgi:LysR substrate binding domain